MARCEFAVCTRAIWSADGLIYFFVTVEGLGCMWAIWAGRRAHMAVRNVTAPLWA